MAKTSSTVHLEESTWKEINEYQAKFGCGRNDAIERMFVERRLLLNLNYNVNSETSKNITADKKLEIKNNKLDLALDSVYEDMPD